MFIKSKIRQLICLLISATILLCLSSVFAAPYGSTDLDDDALIETVTVSGSGTEKIVDLGGMHKISRIEILWKNPSGGEAKQGYKIFRGFDKINYQEIIDKLSSADDSRTPFEFSGTEGRSVDVLKFNTHAVYLRIYMTKSREIAEVNVYGKKVNDTNLALNKTITPTGGLVLKQDGLSKINDGVYSTGMLAQNDASRWGFPYGVIIDLGEVCHISDAYCRFASMQGKNRSCSYTISGSADGSTYTQFGENNIETNESMLHYFSSNSSGNPYWNDGFCLTQNTTQNMLARYIMLEVAESADPWTFGVYEIEIMGTPDRNIPLTDKIGISADFGIQADSISGKKEISATVTLTNSFIENVEADIITGLYRNGALIYTTDNITVEIPAEGSKNEMVTIANQDGFEPGDCVCIWAVESNGNSAPLTNKVVLGSMPSTQSAARTLTDGIFSLGYDGRNISADIDAGTLYAGRMAALKVFSEDKTSLLAYEISELDADGKAEFNFFIEAGSGNYPIQLSAEGMGSSYWNTNNGILKYINTIYFKQSYEALYAADTPAKMHNVLTNDFYTKNMDLSEAAEFYNEIGSTYTDELLVEYIQNNAFSSFEDEVEFKNTIFEKVIKFTLYGALNNAKDGSAVKKILTEYENLFDKYEGFNELDAVKNYYQKLRENAKTIVCGRLAGCEIKDDFTEKVEEAVYLGVIEAAEAWTEVRNIITQNTSFFGENNPNRSNADMSKVYKAMKGKKYPDAAAVRSEESVLISLYPLSSGGSNSKSKVKETYTVAVSEPVNSSNNEKNEFTDLDGYSWAKMPIKVLAEQNIINGVGGTCFAPGDSVKREEFIKMLVSLFELNDSSAECSFIDVPKDHWSAKYIASAESRGLIKGKGKGLFGLGDNITREEMAAMCFNFSAAYGYDFIGTDEIEEFNDSSLISDWAWESVRSMQLSKIIKGNENGLFAPLNESTRAEAAQIIYNLLISVKNEKGEI